MCLSEILIFFYASKSEIIRNCEFSMAVNEIIIQMSLLENVILIGEGQSILHQQIAYCFSFSIEIASWKVSRLALQLQ